MSIRDGTNLSAREREALAQLAQRVEIEDPGLAAALRSRHRFTWPRFGHPPLALSAGRGGAMAAAGVAAMLAGLGLPAGFVVSVAGASVTSVGLFALVSAAEARIRTREMPGAGESGRDRAGP